MEIKLVIPIAPKAIRVNGKTVKFRFEKAQKL